MFKTFINIFRVPELRNKVLFTLFMLAIYRIGYHVPLPGVDQSKFAANKFSTGDSAGDRIKNYVALFSGGDLNSSTVFGLGIMPYISASIIFQLLTTVVPTLEKLQKEGETGRKKIQEWTRYATVPMCMIQAIIWLSYMRSSHYMLSTFASSAAFWFVGLISLTAGCVFLMWLGEQIDEYGLGNGISLIILAGIVARMPAAIGQLVYQSDLSVGGGGEGRIGPGKILFLMGAFVFIVAGSILITQAQRRIPIQQAKHTRGRRIYGGQRQYLPLRVNHGGVMPIIFAQSLMLFPTLLLSKFAEALDPANRSWYANTIHFLNSEMGYGRFLYVLLELVMIYFFAYFWTTVQFQPKEMANQLRDYGSFIPGLRPGKRTADYLEKVMMRITYVGAAFLCIIAVVPTAVSTAMDIPQGIANFLGGTGLLIVVSVALDIVQRIEANLLMRNYGGFLSGPGGGKGKRIKGRQY
ncbi:MAG TPA: preprotein translocase subunit SecY [Tepidisphaeraceae bacterium]|jgi:preprotein translocase subunit SecY|nr:preprotein translocase subunit SecY [Tepidisphaeraceae bacterium]